MDNKHEHILKTIRLIHGSSAEELFGDAYEESDAEHCASKIIREIYSCGNCGQLVRILKHIYPETKPVRIDAFINPENNEEYRMIHFVADIDGTLYDIEGEFMNSNLSNYVHEYLNDAEFENELLENYSFKNRGPIG